MKILYLFKNSGLNIEKAKYKLYPEMFYGYFEIKKHHTVDFLDVIKSHGFFGKLYNKIAGQATLERYLFDNVSLLNEYDLIYATTDGIAIEVAKLKRDGLLKSAVVANAMSVGDNETQRPHMRLLRHLDCVICFSKRVEELLNDNDINNTRFVEFGVDVSFYQEMPRLTKKGGVLSIGLDSFRDWGFFIAITKKLPNVKFRVVANDAMKNQFFFPNVEFIGNVSFVETRAEISESSLVFLPTRSNSYFSGQTTLFNVLSMNRYVFMPSENVEGYDFDRRMFYDIDESVDCIALRIEELLTDGGGRELSINHKLLVDKYNAKAFARKINSCFSQFEHKGCCDNVRGY